MTTQELSLKQAEELVLSQLDNKESNLIQCKFCGDSEECNDYVYCYTCHNGNLNHFYFCSDCKASARKKHLKKFGHNVQWTLVNRLSHNTLQLMKGSDKTSKNHNLMVSKTKNERSIEKYDKSRIKSPKVLVPMVTGELSVILGGVGKWDTMSTAIQSAFKQLATESGKNGLSVSSIKSFGKSLKQSGMISSTSRQWLKAGPIQLALTLVELGGIFHEYQTGVIKDNGELARRCGYVAIKNVGAYGGGYVGFQLGCILGALGGPIGAFVGGCLGAIAGGIMGDKLFGYIYNKINPPSEKYLRKCSLVQALAFFQFQNKDIKNKKIFNLKEINRRYRQFAKIHHPDRPTGNEETFIILHQHYGILLGTIKGINNKCKETMEAVKSIKL